MEHLLLADTVRLILPMFDSRIVQLGFAAIITVVVYKIFRTLGRDVLSMFLPFLR